MVGGGGRVADRWKGLSSNVKYYSFLISQKMIREASRSQALLDDDEYCEEMQGSDGDESVDDLFGMALFVGLFAVVFACIAVKCGGWFFWVGAAVCVLVSGLMFLPLTAFLRGVMETTRGIAVLSVNAPVV